MSVINSNWTVSAHGYENPNPTADYYFEVPDGVTVHFYVKSGESLSGPQEAVPMWKALTEAKGTKYEDVGFPPVETFESGKTCPNIFLDRKKPKTEELETEFETGLWQNGDTLAKWSDWETIPWLDCDADFKPTTAHFLSEVVDHVKELVDDADEEEEIEIELHVLTCRAHHGWNWETNDWSY